MVIVTHAIIKKQNKVPEKEILKAENIFVKYFKDKITEQKMKTYTLVEVSDQIIGIKGTPSRDKFEYELQLDLIGKAIRESRKERNLTQEQLGELIGVQKAQISRLERSAGNVTMETLMKVFKALKAEVHLKIELSNAKISIEG